MRKSLGAWGRRTLGPGARLDFAGEKAPEMTPTCPQCNAPASGKFCGQCGARLAPSACAQCGAAIQAGARFCATCGTPVGAASPAGRGGSAKNMLPFAIAAGAGLVVALIIAYRSQPSIGATQVPAAVPQAPFAGTGGGGAPPDLSKMTPREAFDRLFNRVMTASEQGDTAQANRFTPMAIMAYGNLTEVDADARYDVALIKLHAGDFAGARALSDTIRTENPRHLFGFVLQAALGRFENKPEQITAAYRGFLAVADEELKVNRPEYTVHRSMLDSFRQAAEQGTR